VLQHAINQGKGAALKTGINHVLCNLPECAGIVTADADGQHDPADILKVARRLLELPDEVVLGAREFGRDVPLRSRIGNALTRSVLRLVLGRRLSDTQTGLRGIPAKLLPRLLEIPSSGYDFELDMLIAAKHHGYRIAEAPIRTIYLEGNRASHFNPLRDSMRIYFVLLRFSGLSLLTAAVDNLAFYAVYGAWEVVLGAQAAGRAAAVAFNYGAARKAVFLSRERHRILLPKYLALVVASGAVSYGLIGFLTATAGLPVIAAKIAAESILFLANFVIQRDLVFTRRSETATDWDRYYRSTPITAHATRRYTSSVLVRALRKWAPPRPIVVEIGGANSCFLDHILRAVSPREYHVVDTNTFGLDLLRARLPRSGAVVLHRQDVLDLSLDLRADVVFSVGLIEHFAAAETRRAVDAHFRFLKPGGIAVISFPTPTWLYTAARRACEWLGVWRFPDERPLERAEVIDAVARRGEIVLEKTLWPLVFTQHLVVVKAA
jgi:putative flippase GtrA